MSGCVALHGASHPFFCVAFLLFYFIICIFAIVCLYVELINLRTIMDKITREEALRRWNSAKAQKKEMVEKMRKALYEDYKARTGEEPLTFNIL